jgi:class 3 adenylate cyclase
MRDEEATIVSWVRSRLAWIWTALVGLAAVLAVVFVDGGQWASTQRTWEKVAVVALPTFLSFLGAVVVTRQPGNRISWLLFVSGAGLLITAILDGMYGVSVGPPADPTYWDYFLIWVMSSSGSAFVFYPVSLLLYIFPTGRFLSKRWAWALWVPAVFIAVVPVLALFAEQVGPFFADEGEVRWLIDNPIGFVPLEVLDTVVTVWSLILVLIVPIGGVVALVLRYRRASLVVRTQIRWVIYGSAIAAIAFPLGVWFVSDHPFWSGFFTLIALAVVPITITLAITRYRLFDIDRLISRTLAYTLVVATLTIAYLAVILGVGAMATAMSPPDADLPIPVVATALVAIGFQPVRKRALRFADRLVFGKQRTPYEALAGIKEVELDHLLPRIAQLVTESTAARGAIVWMSTGTELEPAAVFPEGTNAPGPIPLADGQIPRSPNSGEVFPILHRGTPIGAITTVMDQDEELPTIDVRLLKDLASHAATTINGVLEATPLPDGIVTFLMTDIEGSTRLWEEDPERMAVALRNHDGLAQRLIREGGGVLVKWKGEGDSTFSVFTDPGEAVEAAMALQDAIQSYQWDLVRPISIRAALHTGEAELRERDYFGQTVNRCARIRSLVQGGQTLVSAATRELVRSAALETLTFRDLGEHQLRDVEEPERVYEVIAQTGAGPTEPKQTAGI